MQPIRASSLEDVPRTQPWIWRGLIAPGYVTLLTSLWKSGKTTLIAHLLSQRRQGGKLAGLDVRPGVTAVLTEEDSNLWAYRHRRLDLGKDNMFFCRPFADRPTLEQWEILAAQLRQLRAEHGLDLVVVDPLAYFLPAASENLAMLVLEGLSPMLRLAREGLGVLIAHHPAKGVQREGQAARGSGAISGCADILLEMSFVGQNSHFDRRRRLQGYSRFEETPRRLFLELNPEGTEYTLLPDLGPGDLHRHWDQLSAILTEATSPLSRREIIERWPDAEVPTPTTLWRWLDHAFAHGLVAREGTGLKKEPFRYRLKRQETAAQTESRLIFEGGAG